MKNYKTFKNTKLIFAAVLLIALIVRIILLAGFFDFETGFFTNHNHPLVFIYFALCIIGAVGLIISEFAGKDVFTRYTNIADNNTVIATNRLTGIAQIILAAFILFDSKPGLVKILEAKEMYGNSTAQISQELGGKVFILVPVFGILSVVTLIIHAVCSLTARHFENKIPIITLFPVFWAILNVIETFTSTASYIKQSELFVEIFAFTFSMIAFLGYGRAICNIGIKESGKFFIPTAFSASVFSLMAVIYGFFAGEIKENLIFAGLFVFFISLVYNFKANDSKTAISEK